MNEKIGMKSSNLDFDRSITFSNKILILDGISGTGKTMFTPILSSFKQVQNARFEYMFEYLSIAYNHKKLSMDGAKTLLTLLADVKCYDGMISREVNFRPNDLSSVFKGTKTIQYIRQLLMEDGKAIESRLTKENPIVFFVTHQLLSCFDIIFSTFNNRLKLVETVRHPVYLIDHWLSYIKMFGNNSRDFTVWSKYKDKSIPWFAKDYAEKYTNVGNYDKVIFTLDYFYKTIFNKINQNIYKDNILFIPFEKFVLDPLHYIKKLESFLQLDSPNTINKILKKQNVPRIFINQGPSKKIYDRYSANKLKIAGNHKIDLELRKSKMEKKSSEEGFKTLLNISEKYEQIFGKWF